MSMETGSDKEVLVAKRKVSDRTIAISLVWRFSSGWSAWLLLPCHYMQCSARLLVMAVRHNVLSKCRTPSSTRQSRCVSMPIHQAGCHGISSLCSGDVSLKIGETKLIKYEARNVASQPTSGRALFNVTPMAAGAYFNKVECFCFTDTVLKQGEDLEMPVVFFIDPEIVNAAESQRRQHNYAIR